VASPPLYDFFVIATGSSRRQIHTLAGGRSEAATARRGDPPVGAIGRYESRHWLCARLWRICRAPLRCRDAGLLNLEDLWPTPSAIDWDAFDERIHHKTSLVSVL